MAFEVENMQGHLQIITANNVFTVLLTNKLLRVLTKNSSSLVLNMGSDSDFGVPYLSTYSGTKVFIRSYNNALPAEVQDQKKEIEVIYTSLSNAKSVRNSWVEVGINSPSAEAMAMMRLNRVGSGVWIADGYILHGLARFVLESVPQNLAGQLISDGVWPIRKYLKQSKWK